MLKGENIEYLENKGRSDIKAFYFEYEFEYLNIICWGIDAAGRMATKTKALPEKTDNEACENEKWSALIPEKYGLKLQIFRTIMTAMILMIFWMSMMMKSTGCLNNGSLTAGKKQKHRPQ